MLIYVAIFCSLLLPCAPSCSLVLPCASLCSLVLSCAPLGSLVLLCATLCSLVLPGAFLCSLVLPCAPLCYLVLPCATLCYLVLPLVILLCSMFLGDPKCSLPYFYTLALPALSGALKSQHVLALPYPYTLWCSQVQTLSGAIWSYPVLLSCNKTSQFARALALI
jgi:hypothetical protein